MKSLIVGLVIALVFVPQAGAVTRIMCPLSQATRTITEQLPPGWWTTPIVNRLSGTRMENIGGRPALLCIYGSSSTIQRNAPSGT